MEKQLIDMLFMKLRERTDEYIELRMRQALLKAELEFRGKHIKLLQDELHRQGAEPA